MNRIRKPWGPPTIDRPRPGEGGPETHFNSQAIDKLARALRITLPWRTGLEKDCERFQGLPDGDLWFLGVVARGPYQMGRILGTPSPPPRGTQVDIQAEKLYLKVACGFGLLVEDLGEWRPGFYTECRCTPREHNGLSWGGEVFEKSSSK